jgi:hypothetical protein
VLPSPILSLPSMVAKAPLPHVLNYQHEGGLFFLSFFLSFFGGESMYKLLMWRYFIVTLLTSTMFATTMVW